MECIAERDGVFLSFPRFIRRYEKLTDGNVKSRTDFCDGLEPDSGAFVMDELPETAVVRHAGLPEEPVFRLAALFQYLCYA